MEAASAARGGGGLANDTSAASQAFAIALVVLLACMLLAKIVLTLSERLFETFERFDEMKRVQWSLRCTYDSAISVVGAWAAVRWYWGSAAAEEVGAGAHSIIFISVVCGVHLFYLCVAAKYSALAFSEPSLVHVALATALHGVAVLASEGGGELFELGSVQDVVRVFVLASWTQEQCVYTMQRWYFRSQVMAMWTWGICRLGIDCYLLLVLLLGGGSLYGMSLPMVAVVCWRVSLVAYFDVLVMWRLVRSTKQELERAKKTKRNRTELY